MLQLFQPLSLDRSALSTISASVEWGLLSQECRIVSSEPQNGQSCAGKLLFGLCPTPVDCQIAWRGEQLGLRAGAHRQLGLPSRAVVVAPSTALDPLLPQITGCSSGLGRALAQRLHGEQDAATGARAFKVYASARSPASLKQLEAEGMAVLQLDVTSQVRARWLWERAELTD